MLGFFRIVVARHCVQESCPRKGERVGVHSGTCEACGQPLTPIEELNRRAVVLAAAGGATLLLLLGWATAAFLSHRAREREARLLAEADVRFKAAVRGVTESQVGAAADRVQAELGLSSDQRQRLLDDAREIIAELPRDLTPAIERRLEARLRQIYRDGVLSREEEAAREAIVRDERLRPEAVRMVEDRLRERLERTHRSVARGQALVAQGMVEEARREFLLATEVDPEDGMAWANLGAATALLHRPEEARSCYDKALALDPRNWLAHYNLGIDAARRSEREEALRHFEQALAFLPAGGDRERREVVQDLLREPALAEMRGDPRFIDLIAGQGEGRSGS